MSDQSLFDEQPNNESSANQAQVADTGSDGTAPQPQQESHQDFLFVGEGKKYKSAVELDKAMYYAQEHIRKIEEENAALRAKAESANSIDDVLAHLKEQPKQSAQGVNEGTSSVNPADLEAIAANIAQQQYQNMKSQEVAQSNLDQVQSQLNALYGEKAREVLANKASELGLSIQDMAEQAKKSPKSVLAYFNQQAASTPAPLSQGAVNSQAAINANVNQDANSFENLNELRKQGKLSIQEMTAALLKANGYTYGSNR